MDEIELHGITIYLLPTCEDDEDEDYREQCRQLKVIHISYIIMLIVKHLFSGPLYIYVLIEKSFQA